MIGSSSLIDYLPDVILYIATGFVFITVFNAVALRSASKETQNTLTQSLVWGYIYCSVCRALPITLGAIADTLLMIICAGILGYISGRVIRSYMLIKLAEMAKIHTTPYDDLWGEFMELSPNPIRIIISYGECEYEGYALRIEEHKSKPILGLSAYTKRIKGKVIYTSDCHDVVMLDTEKAIEIRLKFEGDADSNPAVKQVQELCEYRMDLGDKLKK